MARYIALRVVQMLLVLVGVSSVLFFILRLSGDPIGMLLPDEASEAARESLRRALGLDRPLHEQYLRYLRAVAGLDFGDSFKFGVPALNMVLQRAPATFQLTLAAVSIATIVGIGVGVLAAVRPQSGWSTLATVLALTGQAVPNFVLAILLILVFSVWLHLLPSFGSGTFAHLILPGVTLSGLLTAKLTRLVRSGLVEVLEEDFIRTAHAKGLGSKRLIWRHALRNVWIPVVTVAGLEISFLMGGAVVTETVYAWPGLGRQLITSVLARDYPVVQATVFFVAIVVVVTNLFVDFIYVFLDPRIRLGAGDR